MKSRRYYTERAAHMRKLAEETQNEDMRKSCLKAAEAYQILAENAVAADPDGSDQE